MTVVSPCTQGLMDSAHPQALLSRLNEQRSQGLYCDVTIVVEDVKFWAHRNILAACSGYFRSAFTTPEVWSCSQVLELMDLKSEVFASILNFIYCSKVASLSIEDTRGLLAAGKRLGIPFLEKLMEQKRQGSGFPQVQTTANAGTTTGPSEAPGSHQTKKETPRPEEPDSARGPRITNAFSITEVGPGNNPFTPIDLRSGARQLPDLGHPLAGCPPLCTLTVGNEPRQTLSEHSYAVSQGHKPTENRGGSQGDNKKATKPTQSQQRQLANRNTGPLKKRHRLRGTLGKSTHPTPAVAHTPLHTTESSTTLINATPVTHVVMSPPALYSQAEAEASTAKELPLAIDKGHKDLDPPTLSPHTEDNISFYGCEYCPEIFSNKALLISHTEIHKKRFVSHLFCKFCRRKFMHLKRLRNHEQLCPKALRGSSDQQSNGKDATDSMPTMDTTITDVQLPPPELPDPFIPNTLQMNTSKTQQALDRVVRPGGSQRAYNCSVCNRAYVTLSSLKRHENVHSWQRAYPCHYCNKVFALAEYRTKHEIWHTGERRYQCIFCLETFMTYYILKNHQKSFHGIDPRIAVNKKSASGGIKGSVYPIKLYRLLPMKFRKRRRYKTYSQTYSEGLEGSDQAPLGCSSPIPPFEDSVAINNPDAGCGTQPLFSMPVTFMATPKVVASVMPRISFDQPCDQDVDQYMGIEVEGCLQGGSKFSSTCVGKQAAPSHSELNGPPLISYNYRTPLVTMQPDGEATAVDYGDGAGAASQAFKSSRRSSHKMPFLELNPLSTMNRLGELSAAAHRLEAMTDQLFQPGAESIALSRAVRGKTETYIAKPACPGPSMDNHVLPLCQITVKIGNEAIIRRRIKGSKLFPRKRKRSQCNKMEDTGRDRPTEAIVESPSLRLRTEVTSVIEPDPCDDPTDRDTADKLWRPYYSYKPKKKKSKKLRSKHKKKRRLSYSMTSTAPKSNEDYLDTSCRSADESISSESMEIKHRLRNSIPKTIHTCDICASPFITVSGLRAHIIGSHPNFCRTCGKQCPSGEPPSCDTNRGGRDFICKNCMENGSCFDNTARSPSTEKRYRCSFCPQRFLYLATKRSHEKKHQETTSNGYNCNYYPIPLNNLATLDVNLKKHAIKKEEGEDEEDTDIESKESLESTGNFSNEKMEPKIEQWEGTGDYMSVSPKMEDPVRINSDGHYHKIARSNRKTPMSLPCTDTPFCRSPVQHRKPQKSSKTTLQHQTSLTSKKQKKDCMDREVPTYKGPLTMPRTDSYDN